MCWRPTRFCHTASLRQIRASQGRSSSRWPPPAAQLPKGSGPNGGFAVAGMTLRPEVDQDREALAGQKASIGEDVRGLVRDRLIVSQTQAGMLPSKRCDPPLESEHEIRVVSLVLGVDLLDRTIRLSARICAATEAIHGSSSRDRRQASHRSLLRAAEFAARTTFDA